MRDMRIPHPQDTDYDWLRDLEYRYQWIDGENFEPTVDDFRALVRLLEECRSLLKISAPQEGLLEDSITEAMLHVVSTDEDIGQIEVAHRVLLFLRQVH